MRSMSTMDDDYEEEGSKNEETMGDIKPRKMKNECNLTLSELEFEMERLTKPLLWRDFQYFVRHRLDFIWDKSP